MLFIIKLIDKAELKTPKEAKKSKNNDFFFLPSFSMKRGRGDDFEGNNGASRKRAAPEAIADKHAMRAAADGSCKGKKDAKKKEGEKKEGERKSSRARKSPPSYNEEKLELFVHDRVAKAEEKSWSAGDTLKLIALCMNRHACKRCAASTLLFI